MASKIPLNKFGRYKQIKELDVQLVPGIQDDATKACCC
jgi:hypothetical protein